jgi:hypothetical protein
MQKLLILRGEWEAWDFGNKFGANESTFMLGED